MSLGKFGLRAFLELLNPFQNLGGNLVVQLIFALFPERLADFFVRMGMNRIELVRIQVPGDCLRPSRVARVFLCRHTCPPEQRKDGE
jgi:hypothetical protein